MTIQGMTVAISPSGLDTFMRALLSGNEIQQKLNSMIPVDRGIPISTTIDTPLWQDGAYFYQGVCTNINIYLIKGSIKKLIPDASSLNLIQQTNGVFQLIFSSNAFTANYTWDERYYQQNKQAIPSGGGTAPVWVNYGDPFWVDKQFNFAPAFGSLSITTKFNFSFSQSTNSWTLPISSLTANANNPSPNIPTDSIIQNQDLGCFTTHVDATTQASIDNIDFTSTLQSVLGGYLASIPANVTLAQDITFDFGLGNDNLAFPNDKGLTVGTTGVASYQGTAYSDTPASPLPVPVVPTDHHLNIYLSDYVFNGLYWAYEQAGLLNTIINPSDLPPNDSNMLMVNADYENTICELVPYDGQVMQAKLEQIKPKTPTLTFESIYAFTPSVFAQFQDSNNPNHLPSDVCQLLLSNVKNQGFLTQTDLETKLKSILVDSQYFSKIEGASQQMGAVVTHDILYTLSLPNAKPINNQVPFIAFEVSRTDFLPSHKMSIGIKKNVQTLQFEFEVISNTATFKDSNILSQIEEKFFPTIWQAVGEPQYLQLLQDMGQQGVPLPMMKGVQFLSGQTTLNIETHFISLLGNVVFIV